VTDRGYANFREHSGGCEVGEQERAYARELYSAYKRWCEDAGERPESQKKFGGRLKERGFLNDRDSRTGRSMWSGIAVSTEWRPRAEGSLNLSGAGFAGKSEAAEPSDPNFAINAKKTATHETMRNKGSEGSEGSATDACAHGTPWGETCGECPPGVEVF